MSFYLILLVVMVNHVSFKGSKVLITLYAIELGASPVTNGVLFAVYGVFPALLAVYAGTVSDRLGFRVPMLVGSAGLALGLVLPFFAPGLATLFVSAGTVGLFYIFFTVAVQHLVGAFGKAHERTRYFSIYSLAIGVTTLLGPTSTGFAIDLVGHRNTYLLLAMLPALPVAVLLVYPALLPPVTHHPEARRRRMTDLMGDTPLRRALVTSGIIETGLELFNFYMPIYGHSIGLSASLIGVLMGAFAVALLVVRTVMPALVRRLGEESVLSYSLLFAAGSCLLFPFTASFPLLLVISFVCGLGLGCCSPMSLILVYNRSPAGRSGEAMGLRQTVNKATEIAIPVLLGSISTAFGILPVFWGTAAMLTGGAVLARRDAPRRS